MVCRISLQLDLILKSMREEFLGTTLLRVTLDARFQQEVFSEPLRGRGNGIQGPKLSWQGQTL